MAIEASVDRLIEWVKADPDKVAAIVEAEQQIKTGRVEIHYHESQATVVRVVLPERKLRVWNGDRTNVAKEC